MVTSQSDPHDDSRDPVLVLRVATLPFDTLDAWHAAEALDALNGTVALELAIDADALALEGALHAEAGPPGAGGPERMTLLHARRDVHHRRADGVASAAASLAPAHGAIATRLARFAEDLKRLESSRADYRERHAHALARGAHGIASCVRSPLVQEGLRLASRALHDKASRLAAFDGERSGHRERHTALKLLAYLARFATKTSPHGVFCATGLGAWHATAASCAGENAIARCDRVLSVAEARKITACLAVDPALADAVIARPNSTLREGPGGWTFWRPASPRNLDDDEVRVEVREHPMARLVLDVCGTGAPLPRVVEEAARRTGLDVERVGAYVARLIEHGLVVGEVEIPWSERRPLLALAQQARAAGAAPAWLEDAEAIEQQVDGLGSRSGPDRLATLDAIAGRLETLPHARPLQTDELVRCDAATSLDVTLPRWVWAELETFLAWYARFYATLYPAVRFTEAYARRFLARFPADAPVDVRDLYHGFIEPSARSRPWGFSASASRARSSAFDRVRDALAASALDARDREEVALEELDWPALLERGETPRHACGVLFQIAARDPDAIATGRCRLCLSALYQGVGLSVARLAHLHAGGGPAAEGPIARELKQGGEALARDGAIIAEVSYMHGGRTANAGLRPPVHRAEIELPGDRATPGADAIPLGDLTVVFESATRRFRLRSRSRDVDVIPVVSSGIDPEGFVSFLIAIGQQDLQPLAYLPGFDVPGVTRWPRFTLGRVVVFRRRWVLAPGELGFGTERPAFHPDRWEAVARGRARASLPRHVFVSSEAEPKPIYVDLESPWLIELLERRVSGATTLHVTEMLPGPDELWVQDARGRYASEFLVHLGNAVRPGTKDASASSRLLPASAT